MAARGREANGESVHRLTPRPQWRWLTVREADGRIGSMNLALTVPPELGAFIESSVNAGEFAGPNDLVTSALYAFRDQVELERIKLGRLRKDVQTGLDQIDRGEVVTDFSVDDFLDGMKRKARV